MEIESGLNLITFKVEVSSYKNRALGFLFLKEGDDRETAFQFAVIIQRNIMVVHIEYLCRHGEIKIPKNFHSPPRALYYNDISERWAGLGRGPIVNQYSCPTMPFTKLLIK